MIIRIKYKNPDNLSEDIIESINTTTVNFPKYCEDLHSNILCGNGRACNGENCKIWIEVDEKFVLAGVYH